MKIGDSEPSFLVVDDNPTHRRQLRRALSTLGTVEELAGGEEVVAALQAAPFSLMCLDLSLPESSGYEVCRRVRAAGINVVVLAVAERLSVTDRAHAKEVGADDVLEKPFRVRELMRRVDYLLRMRDAGGPPAPRAAEVHHG